MYGYYNAIEFNSLFINNFCLKFDLSWKEFESTKLLSFAQNINRLCDRFNADLVLTQVDQNIKMF